MPSLTKIKIKPKRSSNQPPKTKTQSKSSKITKWPQSISSVLVVDMANLVYRVAFNATNNKLIINDKTRKVTVNPNIILHALSLIISNAEFINAANIVLCFEGHHITNPRFTALPEYKSNRPSHSSIDISSELRFLYLIFKHINNTVLITPEVGEADDGVGFAVDVLKKNKDLHSINKIVLLSNDKDMHQLLFRDEDLYVGINKTNRYSVTNNLYDINELEKDFFPGINQELFIIYKALRGDPSDNIKGIKNIGHKRAIEILKHLHALKLDYDNLDQISEGIYNFINGRYKSVKATPRQIYHTLKLLIPIIRIHSEWITSIETGSLDTDILFNIFKLLKIHKLFLIKKVMGKIKSYRPTNNFDIFRNAVMVNRELSINRALEAGSDK